MAQPPVIDSALLEKLERLTLRWRKSLPGMVGGHNRSRFGGPGQEFLDHRQFYPGDDVRAVNWRAYLRLEKLFLKIFQLEPRIPVRILLDASASMAVGTPAKFDYARQLAAALCYVGLVRLETVCLQPFRDRLLDSFTAGGGRHRFSPAGQFLAALAPQGRTDYLAVAREFISQYPQRGLLIILSDFLDEQDPGKPVQYLADFGHELMLVQIYAEQDRTPPWDGELDLEDAETGVRLELSFDGAARRRYEAAFDSYSAALERTARRNAGRYVILPTTLSVEAAIFGSLLRSEGVQL